MIGASKLRLNIVFNDLSSIIIWCSTIIQTNHIADICNMKKIKYKYRMTYPLIRSPMSDPTTRVTLDILRGRLCSKVVAMLGSARPCTKAWDEICGLLALDIGERSE